MESHNVDFVQTSCLNYPLFTFDEQEIDISGSAPFPFTDSVMRWKFCSTSPAIKAIWMTLLEYHRERRMCIFQIGKMRFGPMVIAGLEIRPTQQGTPAYTISAQIIQNEKEG